MAGPRTPGWRRNYLSAEPFRPMPVCSCRGGGGLPPGRLQAPVVAGAHTPGREGGHLTGTVPQPRPAHPLRALGGGLETSQLTPHRASQGLGGTPW